MSGERVKGYRQGLPIALTVLLGTGLSVLAAGAIAHQTRTAQQLQFQRQTDVLATSLQRSINRYTDILRSLSDFYAVSEQTVSRADFNRFVERALATYPGIQALEWAPVVLAAERADFEARVQAEGYRAFQITERESRGGLVRAANRPHYVPVLYLQPLAGNELALGYDLTSDDIRREALETARDSGSVAASGRIRLVQENKNQLGFLVFLPLYESMKVPSTLQQRQDQLQGYLLGVFRVSEVVEESLETLSYDIDFTLTDVSALPDEQFLGFYQASERMVTTVPQLEEASAKTSGQVSRKIFKERQVARSLCPTVEACTQLLKVGGREWAIAFSPAANYPGTTPWSALSTLVVGLLLTAMIARYFLQAQIALAKSQELSALKIRLFSMASHELRTPLSTILLSAQVLESGASQGDRSRIYSRIRAAAKRMNQLLSDLLTLARAESGKIDFAPETLNPVLLCKQLIEEVRFSFEESPKIDFEVSPTTPPAAYLDPQLLRAILTNLLSNAVKYSGDRPQVLLKLSGHPHEIVLQVCDRGIGISAKDQARLYEAFHRGGNVGDIAGTGLGLAVVQACLQLHQGSLDCQSQLGKGTVFTVKLPQID